MKNRQSVYRTEMNAKLRRKRKELEQKLAQAFSKLQIDAELRTRDLQFKIEQEQANMEARIQGNTITSQMKLSFIETRKLLEASIQEETSNTGKNWEKIQMEYQEIFAQEERIVARSIQDQQRNYKFDIDCIKQKCKEELEPSEKEWRSNATKWLNIAGRKVTVKSAEAGNK